MSKPHDYRTYSYSASEMAKKLLFYVHSAGDFNCGPQYNVQRNKGDFFDFQMKYVIHGKGFVECEGRTFEANAGQIFYLDLSQAHRYYAHKDDPWHVLWVHFGGIQAEGYFHWLESSANPIFSLNNPARTKTHFRNIVQSLANPTISMEAELSHHITRILTDMVVYKVEQGLISPSNTETPSHADIRKAIEYIERYYFQPLTVEDIARQATISPFHFSRLFKQVTGFSVMEYVFKLRLTKAKQMLLTTDLSIREIALKVGYDDQSYFGKVFKRYERVTPSEFQRYHSR